MNQYNHMQLDIMKEHPMLPQRSRTITIIVPIVLLAGMLLTACAGGTTQAPAKPTPTLPPSPTPAQGQQLLTQVGDTLTKAKTLHALLNLTLKGQTDGTVNSEVWSEPPGKYRTVVLQSTVQQVSAGSITVSDGKRIWQYDPARKVVYTGTVADTTNGNDNRGIPGTSSGRNASLLNLAQSIFTHSSGKLKPTSATIAGHTAYDVAITPQDSTANNGAGGFDYSGDAYIDKTTHLPLQVALNVPNFGDVTLALPKLELNQPIAESTFTFVAPAGTKELPLQDANNGAGSLTLAQAQQQAGYHLLSIPTSQRAYVLQSINALGAPGSQIYTLNYTQGSATFTVAQGKSLAGLPTTGGQPISLRGTTATIATDNGTTTLSWTENGIGIRITGALSHDQAVTAAKLLA
jgi:outer membrane lipoprotein-sorting protein